MGLREASRSQRRVVLTGLAVLGLGAGTAAITRALAQPSELISIEVEEPMDIQPTLPSQTDWRIPSELPRTTQGSRLLASVSFDAQVQRLISHCALSRSRDEQPTLLGFEVEPVEGGLRIADIRLRSGSLGGEQELDCAQSTLVGMVLEAPTALPGAPFHTRVLLSIPVEAEPEREGEEAVW